MRRALALAVVAACAGCAQFGTQLEELVENTKAHVKMIEGLRQFDAGNHEAAAQTLSAALKMELTAADRATTHKHLAFIHCTAGRERACRDEFRKALAADPAMKLDAAEAGHPVWGPAFSAANRAPAYGGTSALGTGLKQYEDGAYEESAKNLQEAIDLGVPDKQRANAHKHLAFIHCSSSRERECRDEFRKALAADPAFDLAPAEAGHPVWGPIFRSLKATK
ncbi:MAG TPA: TssQ family T6SS-associated lipoprotein [Burkholderiales bacterium]|nr:TssQ family T6SS-associated lipoprotein [Burkholderiales bacterium]